MLEICLMLRNQPLAYTFVLHGSDESLDQGDTAVLPYRAEPWPDALAATPALETRIPKDAVLVADPPSSRVRENHFPRPLTRFRFRVRQRRDTACTAAGADDDTARVELRTGNWRCDLTAERVESGF